MKRRQVFKILTAGFLSGCDIAETCFAAITRFLPKVNTEFLLLRVCQTPGMSFYLEQKADFRVFSIAG